MSPSEQAERIDAACERDGFQLLDTLEELDVSGGAALARARLSRAVALIEAGRGRGDRRRLLRPAGPLAGRSARTARAGRSRRRRDPRRRRRRGSRRYRLALALLDDARDGRRVPPSRNRRAHGRGKRRAVAAGVAPFPNLPPWLRRGEDGSDRASTRRRRAVMREAVRMRVAGPRSRMSASTSPGTGSSAAITAFRPCSLRGCCSASSASARWSTRTPSTRSSTPRPGSACSASPFRAAAARSPSGCWPVSVSFAAVPAARGWSSVPARASTRSTAARRSETARSG